jgi:hypothetical protein
MQQLATEMTYAKDYVLIELFDLSLPFIDLLIVFFIVFAIHNYYVDNIVFVYGIANLCLHWHILALLKLSWIHRYKISLNMN